MPGNGTAPLTRNQTVLLAAWLVVWIALTVYAVLIPPPARDASAPVTGFSAERAMVTVENIAQEPHPLGSLANVRAREYLVDKLRSFGYEAHYERGLLFESDHVINQPQGVYARLEGEDSTGAIMLTAHYDSVAFGPGAADDCAGVAAVVEAARALKAGPPLRNDIIFHLSDGEETGLLGPKIFLEQHPWRDDLAVVVNLEARGTYGPSMMYQTSPNNGWLIRNYIEAVPHPVASSVMFDLAASMPTRSDFWVYRSAGHAGFDFAFIRGLKNYHTMNDNPENLSRRSLQQHGTNALGIARHFGDLDLTDIDEDDRVYFNLFGYYMVHYPGAYIGFLTAIAVLLAVAALVVGFRTGRLRVGGALLGALTFAAALILAPLAAAPPIAWGMWRFGPYLIYNHYWYLFGVIALALAVVFFLYARAARRAGAFDLAAGALIPVTAILLALTPILPYGNFVLVWPIIAVSTALIVCFQLPNKAPSWAPALALALGALPALLLLPPKMGMAWDSFTVALSPVILLLGVVMAGLAAGPIALIAARWPRWSALAPLIVAIPLLVVAIFHNQFTPDRPKMRYLSYGANLDTQDACWISNREDLDAWLEDFFDAREERETIEEFSIGHRYRYVKSDAPLPPLDKAEMTVQEDRIEDGHRRLTVFVRPAHPTARFTLYTPGRVEVAEGWVNGRPFGSSRHMPTASWLIHYGGRCEQGIEVELKLPLDENGAADAELTIIETSYGIQDGLPEHGLPPRPPWIIPETNTMPSWDFSWETLRTMDLFRILQFSHRTHSNRHMVRSSVAF